MVLFFNSASIALAHQRISNPDTLDESKETLYRIQEIFLSKIMTDIRSIPIASRRISNPGVSLIYLRQNVLEPKIIRTHGNPTSGGITMVLV